MSVKSLNGVATEQIQNQTYFEVNCTFSGDFTFIVISMFLDISTPYDAHIQNIVR